MYNLLVGCCRISDLFGKGKAIEISSTPYRLFLVLNELDIGPAAEKKSSLSLEQLPHLG